MRIGVAVVTGANRGIGFEVCRQLGIQGWHIFLTGRNRERGCQAATTLQQNGCNVEYVQMDVSDANSIAAAVKEIESKTDHIDALVNNAGVLEEPNASVLEVSDGAVERSLRTNTVGALLVSQAFWPLLQRSGDGRIINLSSGSGQLLDMDDWAPAYSISKTALNAVTRQLSAAGKPAGITVNSVCPGWVRTEMGTENAPRSVEEGAATITWLATEASPEITGQFLRDKKPIPW